MPLPIFLAAIDLDETLLRSDGAISPHTIAVLQRWLDAGRKIAIATGRPPRSTGMILPDFLQAVPWVCYNGAEVRRDGRILYENFMSGTVVSTVIASLLTTLPDCAIGIEIDNVLHLNRKSERPGVRFVDDLMSVAHLPAAKILVLTHDYDAVRQRLPEFPAQARPMLSEKHRLVQIMAHDADKFRALQFVADHEGFSTENIVAFGDDINDVEMVRCCGLGVAMMNAIEAVKDVAAYITHTNDQDGVAAMLDELLQ